ncbi:MAG: hypothetical protein KDA24_02975 [Deltaproteobacteria bacterium]|nr:hypothetical protein [Deltaproteobacteria bacterium]
MSDETNEHPPNVSTAPPKELRPARKVRYSKKNRDMSAIEHAWTEGNHALGDALMEGFGEWRDRSRRSARKKKDGALRDALLNASYASEVFTREAAEVPGVTYRALRSVIGRRRLWGPFRL